MAMLLLLLLFLCPGDQYNVTVCASDEHSESTCNSSFISIDNTAPVMNSARDTLPDAFTTYPSETVNHPYFQGFVSDVDYQVDNHQLQCTYALATDPESDALNYEVCWYAVHRV